MIKFPKHIFTFEKISNSKTVNRRNIRFLINPEYLIKGEEIEKVLMHHMVECDDINKCVFCGFLRRIKDVQHIYVDNNNVIFDNISFVNDSRICFEAINPDCNKKNYKRNSEEYLRLVYPDTWQDWIGKRKDQCKGRYTEEWFIEKYGKCLGLVKRKEYITKLKKASTKEGFIEKHGEKKGTEKWKHFISEISKKRDLAYFIDLYGDKDGPEKYKQFRETKSYTNSKQCYIDRYGEEIADSIIENKKPNGDKFIEKYGDVKGKIKYKTYCQSKVITLENMIDKYGKDEGAKRFKDFSDKSSNTEENMISRHGKEEGKKRYKEYIKKLDGKCTLEWFITRYGEIEGTKKYETFCESSVYNLEVSIRKYGEIEGRKRYLDYIKKIGFSGKGYSLISQDLFWKLYNTLNRKTFKFAELNNEYIVMNGKTFFRLDFFDSSVDKCIEFNGDYWHAHPRFYKPEDYIYSQNMIAEDVWKKDKERICVLKENGIDTLVVWECEYKENTQHIVDKCLEFLET